MRYGSLHIEKTILRPFPVASTMQILKSNIEFLELTSNKYCLELFR